jgi:formylmethanofuran dehydrogenase subunit E
MRCDNCGEYIFGEPYPFMDLRGENHLLCRECFNNIGGGDDEEDDR